MNDQYKMTNIIAEFVWQLELIIGISMTIALPMLLYKPAWYGRHAKNKKINGINARIAWCLQECPSFLIPAMFAMNNTPFLLANPTNAALILYFCGHYLYRSFVYAFQVKNRVPASIFCCATIFTCINGFIIGYELCHLKRTMTFSFILGFILCMTGLSITIQSDAILLSLKPKYQIPRRGLFQYVSCANYSGECLEWIGFAIAAQTIGSGMFAYATMCNLFPRALSHHQWYQDQFKDYPRDRKALIPFII